MPSRCPLYTVWMVVIILYAPGSVRADCPAWSASDDDASAESDLMTPDISHCKYNPRQTLEGALALIKDLQIQISDLRCQFRDLYHAKRDPVLPADMDWRVILRREDGSVSFSRSWQQYREGFGKLEEGGEGWLGLETLSLLTSRALVPTIYSVRVELEDWQGRRYVAEYGEFSVGPKWDQYRLQIQGYLEDKSTAGDAWSSQDGARWSTPRRNNIHYTPMNCCHNDAEPDPNSNKLNTQKPTDQDGKLRSWNCGIEFELPTRGWWYTPGQMLHPTGDYIHSEGDVDGVRGIRWDFALGIKYSFKGMVISIKPNED